MINNSLWPILSAVSVLFLFQSGHQAKYQEKFESLDRAAKMEMIRKWDRFKSLSPAQQESIRSFHEKLSNHPDKEKLKGVLVDYHRWLQALSQRSRAGLQDIAPDKRLAKVKEIWDKQNHFRPVLASGIETAELDDEDSKVYAAWVFPLFAKQFGNRRRRFGGWKPPEYTQKNVAELRSKLSHRGKKILDLNKHQLDGLIRHWSNAIFRRNHSQKQLAKAYDSLSAEEKEKLSKKSVEEIHFELRRMLSRKRMRDISKGSSSMMRGGKPSKEKDRRDHRKGKENKSK